LLTCSLARFADVLADSRLFRHGRHRITNGVWSDYATMAVRTGGPGPTGLSMLLVPLKGHPGVTMRRLKVSPDASLSQTLEGERRQHSESRPAKPVD